MRVDIWLSYDFEKEYETWDKLQKSRGKGFNLAMSKNI